MKALTTLTLLLLAYTCLGQQQIDKPINLNQFEPQTLGYFIHQEVNHVRDSLAISSLKTDMILVDAAKLQATYCKKAKKTPYRKRKYLTNKQVFLTHKHKKQKLRQPINRVRYFGGMHKLVDEILSGISLKAIDSSLTYQQLAQRFVDNWVNYPLSFDMLKNPLFTNTGIFTLLDIKTQRIYVAQVLGSPLPNFDNYHTPNHAYHILPTSHKKCNPCNQGLDTLHRISAGFGPVYKDGKVFFYYTDLPHFKRVFKSNRFQFAVDLILRRQFPCGKPNALYGSIIHDGYLGKPIKRNQLLKTNQLADTNRLYAPLLDIPFELDEGESFEMNLLIVRKKFLSKKKNLCRRLFFSPTSGYNLTVMQPDLKLDTALLPNEEITTRKIIKLEIPFEKNKYQYSQEDIQPLYDSLQLNKFNIKRIAVTAYASVEGTTELNLGLQKNRAKSIIKVLQSYQLDSIPTRIQTFENWGQLKRDIRNTRFAYLAKMDQQSVKNELKKDSVAQAIEPILAKHRKAIVRLGVIEKLDLEEDIAALPATFNQVLTDSKTTLKQAIAIQSKIFQAIETNELAFTVLDSITIPLAPKFIDLLNNEMIFKFQYSNDFPKLEQLQLLGKLAIKRPAIQFNSYGLILHWWYNNPEYKLDYRSLLKHINQLSKSKSLESGEYYKLLVNYHITLATHLRKLSFKGQNTYRQRKQSVDFVVRYHTKASYTADDALVLANYLVYHGEIRDAVALLRPFTLQDELNEALLFYYLSISIFRQDEVGRQEFEVNMDKAKQLDQERYCQLFGYPKLSFQLLRNEFLKAMYCETCE